MLWLHSAVYCYMTAAKCGNWDRPLNHHALITFSCILLYDCSKMWQLGPTIWSCLSSKLIPAFFVTLMSRLEIAVWTREKEREKKAYTIKIELYNLRNLIDKIKIAGVLDSHPKLPAPYVSRGLFIWRTYWNPRWRVKWLHFTSCEVITNYMVSSCRGLPNQYKFISLSLDRMKT